ncbi:SGNH/GDSL hydrolase family protein [Saccharothrix australiensis]|uniref:GDSL-like lipase/acylhydrolase family protein n=1 Tax=Saccharothrix australiensis TaxID=2072 RepID=A0A495W7D1_9PSEU|nr:SGNH/GDSL hydrolase family protein [Saccharothrix australiensis]RKT57389.1 GDSL-like lipase/acylhydrolase family protein [Saccharothrix australiensis]
MRPVRTLLGAALAAAAALLTAVPAQAQAGAHYVALGDSYSSGTGTGSYYGDSGSCKRSQYAYPALWAASHAPASFKFVACSGARTGDVLANQVGALSAATTLVSISIGGNDAGFTDVISTCTFGSDQTCRTRVEEAKTYATKTLPGLLDNVYAQIRGRAPSAKVVVLGYPRLYKVPGSCSVGLSDTKRSAINSAADTLHSVVSGRAAAKSFTYRDLRGAFSGHEICSSDWWLNSLSWPVEESYHPNRDGQRLGYLPHLAAVTG